VAKIFSVTLVRKIISLTMANIGYRSHTIFNNISIVLLFSLAVVEDLLEFYLAISHHGVPGFLVGHVGVLV
jgi:hypothetical protein